MSVDNSSLKQKIQLRLRATRDLSRFSVLETHAGEGNMTKSVWLKMADKVLSIEKEKGKFKLDSPVIEDRFERHMELMPDYDVIDMDAYGLCARFFEPVLSKMKVGGLLIFTEHVPFQRKGLHHKGQGVSLHRELQQLDCYAYHFERSLNSPTMYGFIIK